MNYFYTQLSLHSQDKYLRADVKYYDMALHTGNAVFGTHALENVALSDILSEDYRLFRYEDKDECKGIPTGQAYIDEDGDIIDYQPVTEEDHPGRLKYAVTADHILISSIRLAKSPALNFDEDGLDQYVFSNGFYIFQVKNGWNKRFVLYLLRSRRIKELIDNNIYRGIGISAYRAEDLLKLEVKNVTPADQEKALSLIRPYEEAIREQKSQIKSAQSIIDEIFADEFGFDYTGFEALKKHTRFHTGFSALAGNPDLRFSAKFHRDAAGFVMRQLTEITEKKLKHFLAEPIVLGASVSPDDYADAGDFYFISMATIKTWAFDPTDANFLSDAYVASRTEKTVRKGDIIFARSGEGTIGKAALIEDDSLRGIFADFTMRIRLKNYSPRFAYYYFRTSYFQYLVEVYKKGLGNNTNIFPVTLQEFPMPDISAERQERIVEKILSKIAAQENILAQIAGLRDKINDVIETVMK